MEKTELKKKVRRLKLPMFPNTAAFCDWIKENVDIHKVTKLTFDENTAEIVEWEEEFCLSNDRKTKWDIVHGDDDGFFYSDSSVKEFIEGLKDMITAEENVARGHNNSISQAVRAILFGFRIQIDKRAGSKLI